ncbi:MAG: tetratricopeptide repeat protein [Chlorobium sp.]|nr:MAG: tetratricopeptide repeat protein [Chlorobium sp.]
MLKLSTLFLFISVALSIPETIEEYRLQLQANALYEKREYIRSESTLRHLLKILPQSENTESSTFNLACTLYKQGKYSEAASMFAHKSKPSVEHEDITLKSLFNQGDSYAMAAIETTTKSKKTEYFQTSLDRFKLLLLTNPNDGDAKVNYEIILRYLHELDPPHHASSSSSSDQKSKPLPKTGVSQDMVDRLLEKAQQDESSLMRKLASKKSTAAKGSSNNLDW